jgi:hypothetical protein
LIKAFGGKTLKYGQKLKKQEIANVWQFEVQGGSSANDKLPELILL